jgi:tRNA(adenine34) deaminase
MDLALELARQAADEGEVPVGCVIVRDGQVVGRGRNHRETGRTALGHAEIQAIDEACRTLGGWRLWECTLYVTLEPCPMCAGAILNARIPRVVYGAADSKAGFCGSVANLFAMEVNHHPEVVSGIREPECGR